MDPWLKASNQPAVAAKEDFISIAPGEGFAQADGYSHSSGSRAVVEPWPIRIESMLPVQLDDYKRENDLNIDRRRFDGVELAAKTSVANANGKACEYCRVSVLVETRHQFGNVDVQRQFEVAALLCFGENGKLPSDKGLKGRS